MGNQLPPPPVPTDADLTHYDDMPLVVRRLRDSGIAGEPNAEVFRCAVLLWCVSWHQLPAGSLPDNDDELCRLVGLGRDMKTWRKVRAGALRGWRLFADGRLYHRVVTEKVMEGWNRTRMKNWGLACDRQRKENKAREERREPKLPMPDRPAVIPLEWPADDEGISAGKANGLPPENALKGIEGNRIEDKKESPPAAASVGDTARAESGEAPQAAAREGPRAAMASRELVDEAFRRWTVLATDLGISDVGFLNSDRRAALTQRLTEVGGLEGWDLFLTKIREAKFLIAGDTGRAKFWVGLGKLLEPETFSKILEDRYAKEHERAGGRDRKLSGTDAIAAFAKAGSR